MAEMLHTTQQRQEEKQQQGEHQKDDYDEGGKRPGLYVSQAVYTLGENWEIKFNSGKMFNDKVSDI